MLRRQSLLAVLLVVGGSAVATAAPVQLRSCIGQSEPNPSFQPFNCTFNEVIPGSFEEGSYFFLDLEQGPLSPNPVFLQHVVLDLGPSANARLANATGFAFPNHLGGVIVSNGHPAVNGDQVTFDLTGFTSATHFFVWGMKFVQRTPAAGGSPDSRATGADLTGATVRATFSDGSVLSGPYVQLDIVDAIVRLPARHVDPPPPFFVALDCHGDVLCQLGVRIREWPPCAPWGKRVGLLGECPRCVPGRQCEFRIDLEGQAFRGGWKVDLVDPAGKPLTHRSVETAKGRVLFLTPGKDGELPDDVLAFTRTKSSIPAIPQTLRAKVSVVEGK
jgi:hypothetical protein